jgi:hypothetical protein
MLAALRRPPAPVSKVSSAPSAPRAIAPAGSRSSVTLCRRATSLRGRESVDDRGRGAWLARRDEGASCWYVTEEQRSQAGCIGRESERLSYSRPL